jgi:chaperonin GroES
MATKFKIRPLGDRVVVEPLEAEEKTKGGIILPDTAKEKPQEGKVVAVGKGKLNDKGELVPMEVKVGDKVLYGKYSGTEVTVENKQYIILREEDILAIVEEK